MYSFLTDPSDRKKHQKSKPICAPPAANRHPDLTPLRPDQRAGFQEWLGMQTDAWLVLYEAG